MIKHLIPFLLISILSLVVLVATSDAEPSFYHASHDLGLGPILPSMGDQPRSLQLTLNSLVPNTTPPTTSSSQGNGTLPPTLSLDESCDLCVDAGCTYCDATSYYAPGPSVCVCEGLDDGRYGGCADFSWNSSPRTICEYRVGDRLRRVPLVLWPLIGLASVLFLCFFWTCCCDTHDDAFRGNPSGTTGFDIGLDDKGPDRLRSSQELV